MKNFKQPGNMLTVAPSGANIASGDLIQKGDLVGVAATLSKTSTTIDAEKQSEVALKGVFKVSKAGSLAITQGDKLYSAFTNLKGDAVNKTSSARTFVGWAWKDAATDDTTVEMLLPLGGE